MHGLNFSFKEPHVQNVRIRSLRTWLTNKPYFVSTTIFYFRKKNINVYSEHFNSSNKSFLDLELFAKVYRFLSYQNIKCGTKNCNIHIFSIRVNFFANMEVNISYCIFALICEKSALQYRFSIPVSSITKSVTK